VGVEWVVGHKVIPFHLREGFCLRKLQRFPLEWLGLQVKVGSAPTINVLILHYQHIRRV
jgi:hypothetical protein